MLVVAADESALVDLGVRSGVFGAPPPLLPPGGGDATCFVEEEGTGVRFLLAGRLALAMGVLMEA